jgi:hypothetical protein
MGITKMWRLVGSFVAARPRKLTGAPKILKAGTCGCS